MSLPAYKSQVVSEFLSLQWVHELHRLAGILCFWGAIAHAAAHLVRWGLRGGAAELHLMLLRHVTGLSGSVALVLLVVAVLPMWRKRWFRRLSFERRHWLCNNTLTTELDGPCCLASCAPPTHLLVLLHDANGAPMREACIRLAMPKHLHLQVSHRQ